MTEGGGERHDERERQAARPVTGEEQAVKLAELEQRARSNTRRVEQLERSTSALNKLATSVELLVAEQRHQTAAMREIRSDVVKLDGKVELLEGKPGRRWESVVEKLILTAAAALAGFILALLGIG